MKKIILSVALSGFLAIGQAQAQSAGQCPVHRLTVTQIKTIAPDAGISSLAGALLGGVAAVTGVKGVISVAGYAAYASDHFVFDTNLLDPDTKAGWDSSMSLIDSFTSGQDDLIVHFNGTTIVPGPAQVFHEGDWGAIEVGNDPSAGESTGIYQPMFSDSRLIPDTQMSFFEFGTLRLIEYDEGGIFASESDDMGTIVFGAQDDGQISEGTLTVVRDCLKPGVREALIAQGQEDLIQCSGQAIYEVSFKVEPNQGNLDDVPERLICGSDMCSDADDLSGFDFRDGTESDLLACEAGYEPWNGLTGEASIVTFKNDFITAFGNYRVCELVPARLTAPSTCGADFLPLANVGDLNDGDIIVLKGKTSTTLTGVEYLASSAGQYLAICDDCVPGAPTSLRENAVVNVIDPNRSAAQWIVKKLASNTFALRSESGKYLARCDGCIPGVAGDSAFVHVSDPTNPVAQFTIETALAANEFSLRSDNNRYLSACLDCVPDQPKLESRYNASLHHVSNSDTSTGWEISVRQKLRVDPVIYDADRTFVEDITVKPSEIWVIDPGAVVTIEHGATLFIEDGGSIENNGTIINNGSIRIGNLGKLLNQGVITNNEIIRLSGGVIDNPGVIDISGPSNHIQNYAGVINNSGVIFDPWGNYFGINPTPNLPEKGLYLGPDGISEKSCGWLDSPSRIWNPVTRTCTVGSAWLRANKSLTIANGASLVINGIFTSDGTINNNGIIDNSNGLVRQCGSFNGTNPIAPGNFDTACIKSTEQLLCESYNGQWNGVDTCENVSGKFNGTPIPIAPAEVLTIADGITWEITGLIENDGEIHVEAGGSIILLGGLITNRMTIINAGLIALGEDGSSGFLSLIENTFQISNYGSISLDAGFGGNAYIHGDGGYVDNHCGSVYGLERQPQFVFHNTFFDIACPPPPPDSDNDGVIDSLDAFPYDANEITDTDGDGVGDVADAFPLNASESSDIGDNDCGLIVTQSEDSGNGCGDNSDLFPLNALETIDTDGDCGVITVQTTTSGNGCGDISDVFPLNNLESKDTDGDCGFIATQSLESGNGCGDNSDALPGDPGETLDSDADGVGDNADSFPNDGDNLRMIAVDNSNGWSLKKGFFSTSVMREPIPEGLPAGVSLPLGFVVLEMRNGSIGSTAEITLTYPDAIDPTLVWWKFGSTASNIEPHWYMFDAAVIAGNSVTLTIRDGGFGDDDLVENGVIVDPGGLGPRETVATNISTSGAGGGSSVSPWLLLLLTGFYGLRTRWKAGAAQVSIKHS